MRSSHTTKRGKAKCLAYRNGKRCGRVAVVVGFVLSQHLQHASMCRECSERLGAEVAIESAFGFKVRTTTLMGYTERRYTPTVKEAK